MKSRQEIAFDRFAETFIKLVQGARDVPDKREVLAWWADFFEHPGVRDNMIQAFSNFMWGMDIEIEGLVNEELGALTELIPLVADPEDRNTLAIQHALKQMTEDWKLPLVDVTDLEVDTLVADDEYDDSRPAGL